MNFFEEFEEQAVKKPIEEGKRIDEELKQENEEKASIYAIPKKLQEKGYFYDDTGVYCPLEDMYYLKMWREKPKGNSKKSFCYAYYDKETSEENKR